MFRTLAPLLTASALALISCSSSQPHALQHSAGPSSASQLRTATSNAAPGPSAIPHEPASGADSAEPLLLITDSAKLRGLEAAGLSFRELLARIDWQSKRHSAFELLASTLERDLADAKRRDPTAGVGVAKFSHRLFDVRWLRAPQSRFELIAVVNRLDRKPFHGAGCGEVRLIYRLAYSQAGSGTQAQSSRLPMTVGFEFVQGAQPETNCSELARRWFAPAKLPESELAHWLVSEAGPLHQARLDVSADALRVVVNLQQVRWPSTVRPDLAGHAEYLMRAFKPDAQHGLVSTPLENTIDPKLLADARTRTEFLHWLTDPQNLLSIDHGTPRIPERFLAERAISVTPRGLARLANRPFRQAFAPQELSNIDYSVMRRIRSPEGLLRRLDQLSCQGCHEVRSIAGFHLLGVDSEQTPKENALAVAASPHTLDDLPRRASVVRDLSGGVEPSFAQDFAERSSYAGYGAHCTLSSDPSFASWTCDANLRCSAYDGEKADPIGICLPIAAGRVGDPCEIARISQTADPHRDRATKALRLTCAGGAVCNSNRVGFPGGMCTEDCSSAAPATCGSIAILDSFNACLARSEPFLSCLRDNVTPAGLRACSASAPCRDDYICAGAPGHGACIPPYFLFQLRVDGHP